MNLSYKGDPKWPCLGESRVVSLRKIPIGIGKIRLVSPRRLPSKLVPQVETIQSRHGRYDWAQMSLWLVPCTGPNEEVNEVFNNAMRYLKIFVGFKNCHKFKKCRKSRFLLPFTIREITWVIKHSRPPSKSLKGSEQKVDVVLAQ